MKLRVKIQKSMVLVIATTLIIAYAMITFVVYRQNVQLLEEEIRQEAAYIKAAVDISGEEYLSEMDEVRKTTRVTLINRAGEVLYDSNQDEVALENHKDRPEVQEAFEQGSGQDVRRSNTLKKNMFYYSIKLSEDEVLRVSKGIDTMFYTALGMLPGMILIAIIMTVFAFLLSKWQIHRLTKPINELNLEHPLENETYEELTPLLESMDRQNREKEAIANMRKEFSANVSHELKTPLTSISGYAEIMKSGLVKPEDMNNFSERIYNEASRLIKLVEDIIKVSKLDEGRVELEKEEVDLYQLTREIVSRLSLLAYQKNIRLELIGETVIYMGVKQLLDEMIYNICENAIKYNHEGGSVTIWVGNTLDGKKVIVSDTGIGIPKDQQDRIFERFYRVDKSHSKETGGTGLGLSIVKHAAIYHNAQISVESDLGKGTKMEVKFHA